MGVNHDLLADRAGRAIVSKIINRVDNWGQVFSDNINKQSSHSLLFNTKVYNCPIRKLKIENLSESNHKC